MQPFWHFCAAQKYKIRNSPRYQVGYGREVELDIYEGPADLNHELVLEHRQGHRTTRVEVIGCSRLFTA